ncbi:MAG: histidine phosphatase family protein [Patescibacteria group bacterium]
MTRVFLIRHGLVLNPDKLFYGPTVPLSEQGHRQIEALRGDLREANANPAIILCSPYFRAHKSAEIIAEAFPDAPLTQDERLVEWQVGSWYDKPLKDFYAYTDYLDHPEQDLPEDIEPLTTCAARIQTVIRDAIINHQDKDIFIVSHREPMAAAILDYEEKGWGSIHALPLQVASAWELTFEGDETPTSLKLRFDRSGT